MRSEYQPFTIDGIDGSSIKADVGILTLEEIEQMMASISPSSPLGRIQSEPTIEENEQEA